MAEVKWIKIVMDLFDDEKILLIDYRYNRELPLLITTNLKPDMLKRDLGERICDRIREMCAFAPVTAVSQRRRSETRQISI